MENKRKRTRKKRYKQGYRKVMMQIMLTCGAVSYNGIHMLEGQHRMYTRKLKDMEEEGIVCIVHLGKKKAARLRDYEKRCDEYIGEYAPGYYGHYRRYGMPSASSIGKWDSDKNRSRKAYRESEVVMMMYGADVHVLPEEKPVIREGERIPNEGAYYYGSLEIKEGCGFRLGICKDEMTEEESAVINSRMNGCMISEGGHYVLYHSGDRVLKWKKSSEGQIAFSFATLVNSLYEGKPMDVTMKECIIFAYNDEVYRKIISPENLKRKDMVNTVSGYDCMYAIPYTKEGQAMVRMMGRENWKDRLKKKYLGVTQVNVRTMACDRTENGINTLLFCIPDMVKLRKFVATAEWTASMEGKMKYEIICYDFQYDLVKEIAGKVADIETVKFEEI